MSNKFSSPSLSVLRAAPQYVPLTDICQPKQWKTIPKAELKTKGYPVYGANGLIGYSDEYNHENKTILIACRGASCGAINVCLPKSYVTGNAMCLDNLNEEFDLDFLQHYLQTYDFKKAISGSAQPQITRSGLSLIMIPILPVSLQRKISCILSAVDENKKQAEQTVKYLDSLIKSRFVEMFGDPIENDSKLPKCKWEDVLTIVNGKNQKKVECATGEYPICGSGGEMGRARQYLTKGDSVIIGRKGNINNPILMREPFWNVDTAFGLEPNAEILIVEYLYYYCEWFDFQKLNKAVTIPSLTKADLLKIEMPLPPLALQQEFAAFVSQVDKLRFEAQQQIEKLETLKKSLMQEYFG